MAEYSIKHEILGGDFEIITVQPPAFPEISEVVEGMPGNSALSISAVTREGEPASRIQFCYGQFDGGELIVGGLTQILQRQGHTVERSQDLENGLFTNYVA